MKYSLYLYIWALHVIQTRGRFFRKKRLLKDTWAGHLGQSWSAFGRTSSGFIQTLAVYHFGIGRFRDDVRVESFDPTLTCYTDHIICYGFFAFKFKRTFEHIQIQTLANL